jgi:hypothetical protein
VLQLEAYWCSLVRLGLFALSSGVRLLALLPLLFVREQVQQQSLRRAVQMLGQSVQQRLSFISPLPLEPVTVVVTTTPLQEQPEIGQN